MNTKGSSHKRCDILISIRRNGTNGFWTGCYRISDRKKKIVFENSILPFDNESGALQVASVEAQVWIDGSTAGPSM